MVTAKNGVKGKPGAWGNSQQDNMGALWESDFQTGGPWQEAGEDGQDSEHLLPRVGVCRKAGLRVFGLEKIYRCNLFMDMCPVGEGWRGRSVCSWHERTVSIGVHTQGADGEI